MPQAVEVTPAKWSDPRVLFDNGRYSVVSGIYEDKDRRDLGERWNGKGDELGFPNSAGYPVWHVVPKFLAIPVLHGLLDELARKPSDRNDEYVGAILCELEKRMEGT